MSPQMLHVSFQLAVVLFCLICSGPSRQLLAQDTSTAADIEFFETKIRPVLVQHCYECHATEAKIVRGGLLLDSKAATLQGGDSGPAVVPGRPEDSLLLSAIRHESLVMPPRSKLPDDVIADVETWIRRGAVDPRESARPARLQPVDFEAAKSHWAFRSISDPAPPVVQDTAWPVSPIDNFVLSKLEQSGLQPAANENRRTLIRRATFDLIGLPPTVAEVREFLADESPDAFAKVVDRLLASPHYGERWGRHWLDLVRYATSNGADENHELPNAWRYRDWVVRMLNRDLPLDQFIIRQLAGDLLPIPDDEQQAGDLLTATGLLVLGPKMLAEQDKDKMMIDIVDEQIDTVSRTMFGLTISCARCHDHKFDPITARDYYSLAGIFHSTRSMADRAFVSKWMERPLPSQAIAAQRAAHQKKIDAAKSELAQLPPDHAEAIKQKKAAIEQLEKDMPQFAQVMATEEGEIRNLPVHIRGNHLKPGPEQIGRGMPAILTSVSQAPAIPENQSGRLQLAQWLVAKEHPLTARVMANRIWMWHFGTPLMRSPSNWGLRAEPPTHPELLDWLAQELHRSNWSLKSLHRKILLSSTWQMSSAVRGDYAERDPENLLLWRQNRRRLEAEPVRDSILFVGGGLDLTIGGAVADVNSNRRAIYLPVNRAALYEMFSTFDYVETANHIEQRPVTTVPNQALYLMNNSAVHEQSRRLIEQLPTTDPAVPLQDVGTVVSALFERLYGRVPDAAEISRSIDFLQRTEAALSEIADVRERRLQAWSALSRTLMAGNEFIFVE
ncbi:MAG: PSD1 and planctomycete cytochrome C domain-containing protein [Planctomycetaceae bacterium]